MCDCGIYENGRSVKIFSEGQYPYTAGDYLKIERDGTTINYYLVKVGDDPATEGTKTLGGSNSSIPAPARGFFINTLGLAYFIATTNAKLCIQR
jgi:hypothetical protein